MAKAGPRALTRKFLPRGTESPSGGTAPSAGGDREARSQHLVAGWVPPGRTRPSPSVSSPRPADGCGQGGQSGHRAEARARAAGERAPRTGLGAWPRARAHTRVLRPASLPLGLPGRRPCLQGAPLPNSWTPVPADPTPQLSSGSDSQVGRPRSTLPAAEQAGGRGAARPHLCSRPDPTPSR